MVQKVNSKMLTMAREARGLTQLELSELTGISRSNINKMELEDIGVNVNAVESFSKVLNFPESFFYQQGDFYQSSFTYRKREKVPQKLMDSINANLNIYRLNLQRLLEIVGSPKTDIPVYDVKDHESPAKIAVKLRKHWKMPKGKIDNLTALLEEKGIIIINADFGTDRVDGRTVLTDKEHPLIFLNKNLPGDRQRFTLAYQLGHLIMHVHTKPAFDRDISHEANLFAAEFLMPENDIKPDLDDKLTIEKLAELKTKWKVSMISILYRANDLGAITDNQKHYLVKQFNDLNIRRREPAELDIPRETPKLLRDIITKYKNKLKLSLNDMAAFFHLNVKDFLNQYSFEPTK